MGGGAKLFGSLGVCAKLLGGTVWCSTVLYMYISISISIYLFIYIYNKYMYAYTHTYTHILFGTDRII